MCGPDHRLHISELLDAEGLAVVRDAISFLLGAPADSDTRCGPQRRADALVQMARFVLTNADARLGVRRGVPRLVATTDYAELAAGSGLGTIDDPDHATTELLRPPMVGPTLPFAIA